ncbi:MAG: MtrB/PioB family outer membrane beta-barrel protein [Acidobacteria bacterium]|nr:MtrB/PioB family outer membrane beta-barrel protein [Acidobacteriota bacterium]
MKATLLLIILAVMIALPDAAFVQDGGFKLSGSIGAGGFGTDEDAKDSSKLKEYRDLSSGPFGVFELKGRNGIFYLDAFGENLGRDDMYINVQGGIYGQFRFRAFGDWLTHNFGFGPHGGRTPYINPGSTNLRLFSNIPGALANSSVPPWTSIDFRTERRNIGGNFEFSGRSPWYLLFEANDLHQTGINKVDAAALGTSPGNGFVDLPYPVSYTTHNVSIEGGYQTERGHLSANLLDSSFDNDNFLFDFQNPFFGFGTDTATFAPDNHYIRLGANGMLRQLVLNSTLSARITYDRGTNRVNMIDEVLNTSGSAGLAPTSPSSPVFRGKVENVTAQVSFASDLARNLDTRAYYKYYRRHNSSSEIAFLVPLTTAGLVCFEAGTTSAANVNVACTGDRYGYTKHNPGVEAGYRFTHGNRLSAGFDYLNTNRDRFDADETDEKKVYVQWSNNSLEMLTARFKYQYLQRRSHFLTDHAGFDAGSPYYLERFNRSFDVANLNQHLVKANFDITFLEFLDFGIEAYYKKNKFKDFTLGRLNDRRKEFYGSVSYGDPAKFRVTLFGDVEYINYDSYHRTVNAGSCPTSSPQCFDPTMEPTTIAFNWGAELRDKNWTVEFGADWPLNPKLTIKGSAIVQETRGSVDFQSQTLEDGAPAALLFPIGAYDNTRRRSINPRVVYACSSKAELTIGYAYEKYEYKDTQFDGYQYTIGSGTTTSYLSGIYAFPDYRANIVYGTMRYVF